MVKGPHGIETRDWLIRKDLVSNKHVLELGAGDGMYTEELAKYAKKVTAVEVRSENIEAIKSYVTAKNVEIIQDDARNIVGKYDVIFHVGLLYHLLHPEIHLIEIASMAPVLILDTHYSPTEDNYLFVENPKNRRAGVEERSLWFSKDYLIELLKDLYDHVEIINEYNTEHGRRISVICTK